METLKLLVQYLVIIVMLSVFLELIMPDSVFKPYIKMVMGLVVIAAVLQFFGTVGGRQWFSEVQAFNGGTLPAQENISSIMANGKKISSDMKKQALEQYKQGIAGQVKSLADLRGSYTAEKVEVFLLEDPGANDYGQIKSIHIVLSDVPPAAPGEDKKIIIEPRVDINSSGEGGASGLKKQAGPDSKKLAGIVASFFNINEQQVNVVIKK